MKSYAGPISGKSAPSDLISLRCPPQNEANGPTEEVGCWQANEYIHFWSGEASAPDYEEAFQARQSQYAELGLEAIKIIEDIGRRYAKTPDMKTHESEKKKFAKKLDEIKEEREIEAKRQAKFWQDFEDRKEQKKASDGDAN